MNTNTRSQEIAQKIMDAILRGEYEGGQFLKESHLAEAYQVSQSTVRDALAFLCVDGWLEKIPRRGYQLVDFDGDAVEELYELWIAIGLVALPAVMNHDLQPKLLIELRRQLVDAQIAVSYSKWRHASHSLYGVAIAWANLISGSRTKALFLQINHQLRLSENIRLKLDPANISLWEKRLTLHEALLDAIEQKDQAQAEAALAAIKQLQVESLIKEMKITKGKHES